MPILRRTAGCTEPTGSSRRCSATSPPNSASRRIIRRARSASWSMGPCVTCRPRSTRSMRRSAAPSIPPKHLLRLSWGSFSRRWSGRFRYQDKTGLSMLESTQDHGEPVIQSGEFSLRTGEPPLFHGTVEFRRMALVRIRLSHSTPIVLWMTRCGGR